MSTPHRGQPQLCSNDPDDFIQGGGLYPGGTGIFTAIDYCLWDYNGKRAPNSQVAVRVTFTPTDGSNENKPELIFWSVGPASEYQPDATGGFCFAVGGSAQIKDSSNWHFVAEKFKTNCGLVKGALNGPTGIKILTGSRVTLTRMDQPERNIDQDTPQGPVIPGQQQRKFKQTILVPTAAVFAWDGAGGNAAASTSTAAAVATRRRKAADAPAATDAPAMAPAPAPALTPIPTMAAPAVNGAAPSTVDDATLAGLIRDILTTAEGNAIEFDALPMLLTHKLGPAGLQISARARMDLMKQVKDPAYIGGLAAAHGFNAGEGVIAL